ncbi:hypothetical protein [Deinococcus altitudinis]|uniref:hypothetical protein n=1 Tax=Deinococcus altitudinis TaxID=468914 RepID=UPI0038926AC1
MKSAVAVRPGAASAGQRRSGRRLLAALLVSGGGWMLGGSWAGAEGSFQVRYFLPAEPWYSGLSADLNWRGELPPELYGGQLDAKFSVSGLERQSLSATYSRERTVVLAQYDRSESVYGAGGKFDQTALLFAQQGFDNPDSGLKQIGLTALYTDSSTPEYAYRVISADLNAGGQFSPTLSWTLGTGITRSDSGLSTDFTSGSLSERVRAGLIKRWEGELPASVGVLTSYTATQSRTAGSGGGGIGGQPDSEAASASGNLSLTGNMALSNQENLSANARLDTGGSYGADLSVSSSRLEGWTLGAGVNLSGQVGSAGLGVPAPLIYGWNLGAALTPKPWGVRLGYSGSSGANGSQALDAEAQYQEGPLSAQAGAGVTFQSGVQVAPDGTLTPTVQPAYRASLGVAARSEAAQSEAGSGGAVSGNPPPAFQIQARLNVSASPVLNPQGTLEYRYGGALSGTLSYASGPFQAELNSSLNYAGYTPQQPWSGEFGVQALYSFSDQLQLNVSGRYRPASLAVFQAGLGLRYRF